jgi:hypothetical protein
MPQRTSRAKNIKFSYLTCSRSNKKSVFDRKAVYLPLETLTRNKPSIGGRME